jgi:hypothetical protein
MTTGSGKVQGRYDMVSGRFSQPKDRSRPVGASLLNTTDVFHDGQASLCLLHPLFSMLKSRFMNCWHISHRCFSGSSNISQRSSVVFARNFMGGSDGEKFVMSLFSS